MWSNDVVLSLIDDFEAATCLWNVVSPEYKNRVAKRAAVKRLAAKYRVSVPDLEKKIHNLKTSFRREHKKVLVALGKGMTCFRAGWFAYDRLQFLLPVMGYRYAPPTPDFDPDAYESTSEAANENDEIYGSLEDLPDDSTPIPDPEEGGSGSNPPLFKTPVAANQGAIIARNPAKRARRGAELAAVERDEFDVFGEHIANKLRRCGRPRLEVAMAEHYIHDIALRLDLGMYASEVATIAPGQSPSPMRSLKSPPRSPSPMRSLKSSPRSPSPMRSLKSPPRSPSPSETSRDSDLSSSNPPGNGGDDLIIP